MPKVKFIDRIAAKPRRYQIVPESGEPYYARLERADEPVVEGTAINAASLNALGAVIRNDEISTADPSTGRIYIDSFEALTSLFKEMVMYHIGFNDVMMVSIQCDFDPIYNAALLTAYKGWNGNSEPEAIATLLATSGEKLIARADSFGYGDTPDGWDWTFYEWTSESTGSTGSVDYEMSDTSTNPVQNRAIKEYVDEKLAAIQNVNVPVTQAEYDALVASGQVKENVLYAIVKEDGDDA